MLRLCLLLILWVMSLFLVGIHHVIVTLQFGIMNLLTPYIVLHFPLSSLSCTHYRSPSLILRLRNLQNDNMLWIENWRHFDALILGILFPCHLVPNQCVAVDI